MSAAEAREVLWTLNSHAVYEKLVEERGWTLAHYQRWLTETLTAALLSPQDPGNITP